MKAEYTDRALYLAMWINCTQNAPAIRDLLVTIIAEHAIKHSDNPN